MPSRLLSFSSTHSLNPSWLQCTLGRPLVHPAIPEERLEPFAFAPLQLLLCERSDRTGSTVKFSSALCADVSVMKNTFRTSSVLLRPHANNMFLKSATLFTEATSSPNPAASGQWSQSRRSRQPVRDTMRDTVNQQIYLLLVHMQFASVSCVEPFCLLKNVPVSFLRSLQRRKAVLWLCTARCATRVS